ncbi:tetrapyrrole biosynthesis, uroporphyrinogen III synthase [Atractiella rhizophila]|nr:tetrapyrrole biosynthesis, uroporphyrinogen III synthase [Atractiella rhizophila]
MHLHLLLFKSPSPSNSKDDYLSLSLPLPHTIRTSYIPVLSTQFCNLSHLRDVLVAEGGDRNRNVVFTSPRAVEAYKLALFDQSTSLLNVEEASSLKRYTGRKFFVVGPATKRALMGLPEEIRPEEGEVEGETSGSSEALARHILATFPRLASDAGSKHESRQDHDLEHGNESNGGEGFIYLVGDKNSPLFSSLLREAGHEVDEIQVYSTSPDIESLKSSFQAISPPSSSDERVIALFFSPSSARVALPLTQEHFKNHKSPELELVVGAIGGTTRKYLEEEEGLSVPIVAKTPSAEGVEEAIKQWIMVTPSSTK